MNSNSVAVLIGFSTSPVPVGLVPQDARLQQLQKLQWNLMRLQWKELRNWWVEQGHREPQGHEQRQLLVRAESLVDPPHPNQQRSCSQNLKGHRHQDLQSTPAREKYCSSIVNRILSILAFCLTTLCQEPGDGSISLAGQ